MKRIFALILCCILGFSALALSSCDILSDLENAVTYPESYLLSYEVTNADGTIFTITKIVDGEGNVYYKNADAETVYILEGSGYVKYEKNSDGEFEKTSDTKLTKSAMENETKDICTYAEKSQNKFIPTAKKEADTEKVGRACEVYKLGVGNEENSSYYFYYVDKETGICLGMDVKNTALGESIPYEGERFVCVEFLVDDIHGVADIIEK